VGRGRESEIWEGEGEARGRGKRERQEGEERRETREAKREIPNTLISKKEEKNTPRSHNRIN
jgi:hypothetical protein